MIDETVENHLLFVSKYASSIDSWKVLKKELLKCLPPEKRKLFSTRDPVTKLQSLNSFEKLLVVRWNELTGNLIIFR